MPMRLFLALPLLIAACGSGNGRIDKDDDEDMGEDVVDPGDFEDCSAIWSLTESAPVNGAVAAAVDSPIIATLSGGLTQSEVDACGAVFEVRYVIDTHPDPNIYNWTLLSAQPEWVYGGDRSWTLEVLPDRIMEEDEVYAVEVDLLVPELDPLGIVWTWTTAG